MPTNDLLPFGTGVGANVLDQTSFAALPGRSSGFTAGVANSAHMNKVWRQSAFAAAMIGQFTADNSGFNTVDDGDVATFEAHFKAAVQAAGFLYAVDSGTADALVISLAGFASYTPLLGAQIIVKKNTSANATTTPTININGFGAKTIVSASGGALVAGDLPASGFLELVYDGTNVRTIGGASAASIINNLHVLAPATRTTYTTPGTFTFTATVAGYHRFWVWSAGGGGGFGSVSGPGCASGGSAGSFAQKTFQLTAGQAVTVVVGSSGAGSTSSGSSGGAGGASSITVAGTTYSIAGGAGGLSSTSSTCNSPNAPAVPSFGELALAGGQGDIGLTPSLPGGTGVVSGKGGSAPLGGQGGVGGAGLPSGGTNPGGGGGGSGGGLTGGPGGRGEVWVEF